MSNDDAYADAGVSIDAGEEVVRRIAPLAATTHGSLAAHGARLIAGIGGFAAAVQLPTDKREPVLLAAADGVGTKVELARQYQQAAVVGRDVVAMCVNDLLCAGGQPLAFLDYVAAGKLEADFIAEIVAGIAAACAESDCALIGGETAEMPGTYRDDKFDLAGFAVGIAEKSALLPRPDDMVAGDALIAVASSGAHSNGYSLLRKILREQPALAEQKLGDGTVIEQLLVPTRLYCRSIARLRAALTVKGLAHITGGGMEENLPRILPPRLVAEENFADLPLPPLFALMQKAGELSDKMMRRTFNCGIGLVVVVAADDATDAVRILQEAGEEAHPMGFLRAR